MEELANAAGTANGSFYAFYASKEELYFHILMRCQQDMWGRMEAFLEENVALPPRQLVKAAVAYVFGIIAEYPLIHRTDSETMVVLMRKLPEEVTGHHYQSSSFPPSPKANTKTEYPLRGAVARLGERLNGIQEAVSSILISFTM